jgi:hypothetical protein
VSHPDTLTSSFHGQGELLLHLFHEASAISFRRLPCLFLHFDEAGVQ